jgi:hypothetical protein
MPANRQLLFNHIPKTGGVTLRIILNRIYGEKNIFLIKSTDIGSSLKYFSSLSREEKDRFAVVAGHGAELFRPYMEDPFRVTILREPVALFLSQYYYLKSTEDAGFYDEVNRLNSIEEYLDFAIANGQDNLLTRYLSGSVHFLADPGMSIPAMQKEGDKLLLTAVKTMHEYDAVIDLADFDAGIFSLAGKLGWKNIPLYRPANRNKSNPGPAVLSKGTIERLKKALKWDMALYEEFKKSGLAAGNASTKETLKYKLFRFRQNTTGILANILNK